MRTNFDQLLEAGCHFGHLKRKWNPAMAPYIYMERNGIHIIDLNKTAIKIEEAAEALKNIARSGRKILFVSTKKQGQEIIAAKAQEVGMPYITERWAGGMLTTSCRPDKQFALAASRPGHECSAVSQSFFPGGGYGSEPDGSR